MFLPAMVHQWGGMGITPQTCKRVNAYTLGGKAAETVTIRAAHIGERPRTFGAFGVGLLARRFVCISGQTVAPKPYKKQGVIYELCR
jgi:hypothetical protein